MYRVWSIHYLCFHLQTLVSYSFSKLLSLFIHSVLLNEIFFLFFYYLSYSHLSHKYTFSIALWKFNTETIFLPYRKYRRKNHCFFTYTEAVDGERYKLKQYSYHPSLLVLFFLYSFIGDLLHFSMCRESRLEASGKRTQPVITRGYWRYEITENESNAVIVSASWCAVMVMVMVEALAEVMVCGMNVLPQCLFIIGPPDSKVNH